jgi:hypothetical protein
MVQLLANSLWKRHPPGIIYRTFCSINRDPLRIFLMMRKNAAEHLDSSSSTSATDSLNRELATWVAEHGCAWSGTASELLNALSARIVSRETLPMTGNALYAHLREQSEELRSYGIEVVLPPSGVRMVLLKASKETAEEAAPLVRESQVSKDDAAQEAHDLDPNGLTANSQTSNREVASDTPPLEDAMGVLSAITDMQEQIKKRLRRADEESSGTQDPYHRNGDAPQRLIEPHSPVSTGDALFLINAVEERIRRRLHEVGSDSFSDKDAYPENAIANDGAAEQVDNEERTDVPATMMGSAVGAEESFYPDRLEETAEKTSEPIEIDEPIFESTGEALVAILEVQEQLKKLSRQTSAIIDVAARTSQQLSRASGVAIALARDGKVLYQAETGLASKVREVQGDSSFLKSCLETGETLQLQGSEESAARDFCLREGIKSLIVSPFPVGGGLVGAIEFIFQERRVLQQADRITIEAVADAVSAAII